jgi:fructokinase
MGRQSAAASDHPRRSAALRIGIDLGGTKTEGIVMDAAGHILHRLRRPTPQAAGYAAILDNIRALVLALEQAAGHPCTVGIGTPGALSTRTGRLKNSNTVCLNGQPLHADLTQLLGRPVRLANDANCFALSEALDGAAAGLPVVFGVILGTGVGGGIVINGRLIEGRQNIAGEWGHNPLETDGPQCYCGRRGCVETLISGPGVARDYAGHAGGDTVGVPEILARAAAGEVAAEAALQRFFARFGRALAGVINILDPHAIVLGGGLSNMQRLYTEGVAQVRRHVFNDELRTPILPNRHGDSSGVRGAAQLWPAGE